MKMGMNMYIFC